MRRGAAAHINGIRARIFRSFSWFWCIGVATRVDAFGIEQFAVEGQMQLSLNFWHFAVLTIQVTRGHTHTHTPLCRQFPAILPAPDAIHVRLTGAEKSRRAKLNRHTLMDRSQLDCIGACDEA